MMMRLVLVECVMLSYTAASFVTVLDASFCRLAIPRRLYAELTGTFDARCKSVMQSRKTAPGGGTGMAGGNNSRAKDLFRSCCQKMLPEIGIPVLG
jgi:hypothetical protein